METINIRKKDIKDVEGLKIGNALSGEGNVIRDPNDPTNNDIPENSMDRAILVWKNKEIKNEEVKLKDKWIKIRIRYTGNKLAVITAIKTLYSISYSWEHLIYQVILYLLCFRIYLHSKTLIMVMLFR